MKVYVVGWLGKFFVMGLGTRVSFFISVDMLNEYSNIEKERGY